MDSNYTCLAVISLDSALERLKLLKECKYIEKIVFRYINGNLRDFSSDE